MQVFIPMLYYAVALDMIYINTTGLLSQNLCFLKKPNFTVFIMKVLT